MLFYLSQIRSHVRILIIIGYYTAIISIQSKTIWLWSSSVIKIVKMKYNRINIKWCLVSTSFKIYLDILSYLYIASCSRSFITTLFHSSVHYVPVLVKGLYQTESYSSHVMQLIRIITKLPNSEQSYTGKVKTHKYINRQNQSTTGKP